MPHHLATLLLLLCHMPSTTSLPDASAAAPPKFARLPVNHTTVTVGGFVNPNLQTASIYYPAVSTNGSNSSQKFPVVAFAHVSSRVSNQAAAVACGSWGPF